MTEYFRGLFQKTGIHAGARAKFLSRLFGIFSENIVSIWADDPRARYENLGRPTVRSVGALRGYTLDFTFRERATGRVYVSEMKCEIEYQNFRYFVLERADQLAHHQKPAFQAFRDAANRAPGQTVHVGGKVVDTDGAILVWGAITPAGQEAVMKEMGFYDVLSLERICEDLVGWRSERYIELLNTRRDWCNQLFCGLLGETGEAPQDPGP
ncbi:hypothetical protein [Paracoccus solventivorans]|nr:hypothetical protein [Paracoccus solventivorans]